MTLPVIDGGGNPTAVKTSLDGGAHVPHHNLDALPGSVEDDIAALASTVAAGRLAVDLSAVLANYLANLPSVASYLSILKDAVTASRVAVNVDNTTTGKLDTLHSDLSANAGKLDTLHSDISAVATNQGVPAGGPKFGQNNVITTSADAQFGSQVLTRGMFVTNPDASAELYISHAPSVSATTCYRLKAGLTVFVPCTNASAIYMRSSTGTIAACYAGA